MTSTSHARGKSHLFEDGFKGLHVLYAIALMASAVATFGEYGALWGVLILIAWTHTFYNRSRPAGLFNVGVVLAILLFLFLLFPAVQPPREAARRVQCKNNLKQIMLALHNYQDAYGMFPPAYVADDAGRPMHSWRVLILPYVDQTPLYRTYDFGQHWDDPANRKVLEQSLSVLTCPSRDRAETENNRSSYVAVVGPDTGWPGSIGSRLNDFKDGTSRTIMVMECNTNRAPWTAPRDLTIDEAAELLSTTEWGRFAGHSQEDFFFEYRSGTYVGFADGAVRFIAAGIDRGLARSLLTVSDGQPEADWDVSYLPPNAPPRRLKIGNVIRLSIFLVLALLPLPWVWIHPHGPGVSGRFRAPEAVC